MQQDLMKERTCEIFNKITFLLGNSEIIRNMQKLPARVPFADETIEFLNALSKKLMKMQEAKAYPEVVTLGYWMRRASLLKLKEKFDKSEAGELKFGRGVAFHVAPSNVPVNYAYSLVTGLLTGNSNVVKIPSKDFPQISLINKGIAETLEEYPMIKPYVCLVRYGREKEVNDYLSCIADTRIIWGGNNTVMEIRRSPLGPRAGEITFADRYSLAVINSEEYLAIDDKERFAEKFYNDTFLTDQNACTSPRLVVWIGREKKKAKDCFWKYEHDLVKKKYAFQPVMGINKLTSSYLIAAAKRGVIIEPAEDNYIVRVKVLSVDAKIMQLKDNSGYFFEYDCDNLMEIRDFCDNIHCQTIGFLGKREQIMPLLMSGTKGVDRVVPIGNTMDFSLIWDGYNLVERLTRTVKVIV